VLNWESELYLVYAFWVEFWRARAFEEIEAHFPRSVRWWCGGLNLDLDGFHGCVCRLCMCVLGGLI
jgi:hypothetical protein